MNSIFLFSLLLRCLTRHIQNVVLESTSSYNQTSNGWEFFSILHYYLTLSNNTWNVYPDPNWQSADLHLLWASWVGIWHLRCTEDNCEHFIHCKWWLEENRELIDLLCKIFKSRFPLMYKFYCLLVDKYNSELVLGQQLPLILIMVQLKLTQTNDMTVEATWVIPVLVVLVVTLCTLSSLVYVLKYW